MALSYYLMGKHADAEPLLNALIANGQVGDKEQLALLRGQCLLNLEKPAEAETVFASVMRSRSADIVRSATGGVLEAQHRQGEWAKSIATADKLLKTDAAPDYQKRALYQAAYACHQLKEFARALPNLEKLQPLVKDDPMAPHVAFFRAESDRETGKLALAAENYAAAVAGFEGDVAADVYDRLGSVRFTRARYDDAISALQKSLKLRPFDIETRPDNAGPAAEVQLSLGRSWLEKGDFSRAIESLRPLSVLIQPRRDPPANEAGPGSEGRFAAAYIGVRAALWLGRAYSRQEKYAEAEKVLSEAINKTTNRSRQSNSP